MVLCNQDISMWQVRNMLQMQKVFGILMHLFRCSVVVGSTTLLVSHIDHQATQDDIEFAMSAFGHVMDVKVGALYSSQ